jgi:hypothetical protein
MASIDGKTFKRDIALQNLHDSPTYYAEVLVYHVCDCEPEFVEKGAQTVWNIDHWAT